ncbi:hypothetical protein QJS04_geneDACA005097 [Acorus gramineus]|uniref:Translocation and assembly module TamB C-terminal domain-containing protein n=1 Tax=Acorus gramineus TaxID=55184 RepID=A0AAV9AYE9_ACOGR|nr:hypothetical protein QJS04_geneDACA005097 [Acorus gramineus]
MSMDHLCSPFLGISLHSSTIQRNDSILSSTLRRKLKAGAFCELLPPGHNQRGHAGRREHGRRCFAQFSGRNFEYLMRTCGLRGRLKMNCTQDPFSRSKTLTRYLVPLWKEGWLFLRCSVFVAVLSVIGILVWYGQMKAKRFVEARLLPSAVSILSDYFQRELEFGKIRSLSPLGITLQSCSIGPHNEEFSCGELPMMKLRVRPFASLRRGKIVIDAVLSRPSLLIAQKEDFSWLGIPSPSESGQYRHHSTEEGIDYRTKTRRVSREEAADRWARERTEAAREAAQTGYIVPQQGPMSLDDDRIKEGHLDSSDLSTSSSFFCMDERMHWRDHHCMDTGVEYGLKHADLEKSFGVKVLGPGRKIGSRMIPSPIRRKFRRRALKNEIAAAGIALQQRNLQHSAAAALAYFHRLDGEKSNDPDPQQRMTSLIGGGDEFQVELAMVEEEVVNNTDATAVKNVGEHTRSQDLPDSVNSRGVKHVEHVASAIDNSMSKGTPEAPSSTSVHECGGGVGSQLPIEEKHNAKNAVDQGFISHPFLMVDQKLNGAEVSSNCSPLGSAIPKSCISEAGQNDACDISGRDLNQLHVGDSHLGPGISSDTVEVAILEPFNDRFMSTMSAQVKDLALELKDGLDRSLTVGIEKVIPVTLDVVYFSEGTLMLLGYGDQEASFLKEFLKFRSFGPTEELVVHICMSRGESFPNIHGQLDVNGLAFQIVDAPSSFSDVTASLCFRGQRIFLHNTSGWFGDAPLEVSGDFGINPEDGEFHLMCQVPCVEVNSLMKTFKMRPLLFPLAGSITAVFNCQGPVDAPIFVGSGIVTRKIAHSVSGFPPSCASEAVMNNKEAGAVAAFDHIPFSHVSANFTFNTDNCVADLYGIRANLLDGGEIRGAGNAWICPEGEVDDTAIDVNLSGNLLFDKVVFRYLSKDIQMMPLKIGVLNGETKLSGSLLRPRFDIKWAAPKAEESFGDARGDIIISHDFITVNSSSVAFELYMKAQTSYPDEFWLNRMRHDARKTMPVIVEGVDLDFRMRGFEFFSLISSNQFDSPRPLHLKATGRIKFQGKVEKLNNANEKKELSSEKDVLDQEKNAQERKSLLGEVSLSGIKLNQLILAPQLVGSLSVSHGRVKLDASGRPDENLSVEVVGPLWPNEEESLQKKTMLSVDLQKGQLRTNISYKPQHSANLEVRNLPLDELELASLRGTVQRAELHLNFLKRKGHGILSVLRPKFSGVLGEALDVAARWSGDVITIEKTVLEQASSRYELQGEYVLPGTRDRYPSDDRNSLLKRAMDGQLGSVISSMGRWRMRLEVPSAEVAEMLPLARLLSRSTDPEVHSRLKELFMQSLHSIGFYSLSPRELIEAIRGHYTQSDEVILEDMTLPGLAEFKGHWRGSLDASGGGNGDTTADFDFHGDDWEWGTYKTQRVLAVGAYSNNDGLRLEKILIQKDNATLHADGTLLGPKSNLHFAVLNFPVGLVPTLVQIMESSASDFILSLRQLLNPIKGILHMEGDLRGSLAKPECDVQVRLLDGAIEGIDLGRAEIVASLTSIGRFLFNAKFEPIIQSGHVHIQGSVPVTPLQKGFIQEEIKVKEVDNSMVTPGWAKDSTKESVDESSDKKILRERTEEGWNVQLAESLKGLNWNMLDAGEVRIDADIKDGGMMLITALSPYANWLHGYADIILQVRGTVDQPVVDGSASFHRASISSPVLRKPLTNFGGTVQVNSNRLSISSLESRVSRKGKISLKGNLPLNASEAFSGDKIDLKCEVLEVRAKNILSGQVDSQMQITGSILQPDISGMIKLSHGEAYLPHDKGNGASVNQLTSNISSFPSGGYSRMTTSGHVSRFFGSEPASSKTKFPQSTGKEAEVEKKMESANSKPGVDVRLTDLKLLLGPELRIVYPLILNFAVSGELELNGIAHPKFIKPKGVLSFENGDVNLVATQVRLKRDHLNIAKFEPDLGLDPTLDLALVGSEWQFRIQSRASNWQDNLVVTSTRSVEQDVLSPTEAARVFESQLAESLLEGDGKLAFKKLATSTLETLMPRIEGKGEFGHARWRVVYAPQIPSLLSLDPTVDPLKSLANNISFGTEVEIQLGKRLQASVVRQMKDSEMAMQWTLLYQLTSRLRVLFQSAPSNRLLFEYSATSQD